jgi:ABC-type bacteriocin/lantibiotic exporter with double-glycine peptidase domain
MKSAITDFFSPTGIKRVPLVLQYEVVECGAASLSMLMRYWGLFKPLGDIRIACGVSRDGSNLLNIKQAAQNYGFDVVAKRMDADHLASGSLPTPCILFWNYNHFVVFEGVTKNGRFSIADPGGGRYTLSADDFKKTYSQLALHIRPASTFRREGRPERELLGLVTYLRPFLNPIALCLVIATLLLIPNVVSPGLSGAFVNEFIQNQRFDYGIPILWLSILMVVITIWMNLINFNVLRRIMLRLQRTLTLSISKKIFSVNFDFFATRYRGDVANRLLLGLEISSALTQQILAFLLGLIGGLLMIPVVILISWQLSLVTFLYIAISISIAILVSNSLLDSNRSIQIESGKIGGVIVRMLSDTETIKASGLERAYLATWLNLFAPVLEKSQHAQYRMGVMNALSALIDSIYQYGTIVLAGLLVMQGEINLAGFMAFQVIRGQVITPLLGLGQLTSQLQTTEASLGRLTDLFSVPDDPKVRSLDLIQALFRGPRSNKDQISAVRPDEEDGDSLSAQTEVSAPIHSLQVENLSHRFSPLAPYVLQNLNLKVPAGSMLTIVGPSGSGKSTLVKVLTGLYTPSEGQVLYENHPWLWYPDSQIRQAIGYVSQEVSGMRGTIEENIRLWQPGYRFEDIREAAELACFDQVAMASRQGYQTMLQDGGAGLSGGELQRLELARALLKKPTILFLDEATSALDIPTEIKVLSKLRSLGMTLICVAHRLISAEMSDQVIVLENGLITAMGSPQELRETSDFYRRLKASEVRV